MVILMDIKKIVEQIKSSRNFKMAVVAVLVIAAAGGAYYFLVYLPEMESEAAAAKPPVAARPKSAAAAKPTTTQPAASGVPAVASIKQQPAVVQAANAPTPTSAKNNGSDKPAVAVEKIEPKKHEAATRLEQEVKPQQAARADKKVDFPVLQEDKPLSQNSTPAAEPVSVEPAPVVAESPPPQRRGITPKYNDIMTPVLRGDREATKELLDLGWWVDKPSDSGVTPLMAAIMNRDVNMVQMLLEYGAEPTSQALKLARKNKDTAIASLLEQKGAR